MPQMRVMSNDIMLFAFLWRCWNRGVFVLQYTRFHLIVAVATQ